MNQALIFTSEPPQRQCVAIGILDDQLIEDLEQFNIRVDQTLPQGVVSNVASVFITDDDEQNILITFELDSYGVQEGQQSVEVCAVTSATPEQDQSILAQISTEDGSATGKLFQTKTAAWIYHWELKQSITYGNFSYAADSDYDPLIDEVLTFTAISLQRQCVNIRIIDDILVEPVEQFVVRLNQADSQQEDEATVSITDNDGKISEDGRFFSVWLKSRF